MKSFLQGLKAALRSLRRSPGFALVAWLTLSLGIGAVCAVFPLVNAVIVKGLPFQEAERLVFVRGILTRQAPQPLPLGYLDLQALAEQTDVFESISPVTGPRSFNLIGSGEAEHIVGEMVGPDYFRVLRADLALGRMFTADEARPPNAVAVAVLSHSLWRNRFGSDPAVVDRLVDLNGRRVRIIGVASEDFRGLNDQAQIWLPIGMAHSIYGAHYTDMRQFRWLSGVARLRDGVSQEHAADTVTTIAARLREIYPKDNEHVDISAITLDEAMFGELKTPLLAVFGASAFVLLIACVNVANMLLARGTARAHELALRRALGAGTGRLIRELLMESAVLSSAAAVTGIALALAVPGLLAAFGPPDFQSFVDVRADWSVAVVVVLVVITSALAAGLAPAWFVFRGDPSQLLREGSRGGGAGMARHRAQLMLLVAEVSLALVLLVIGSLITRGFTRFLQADLGFRAENVATIRLDLTADGYKDDTRFRAVVQTTLDQVRALPEVSAAALEGPGLPTGGMYGISFRRDGARVDEPDVNALRHHVTPGYFAALGIPLLAGRDFDAGAGGSPTVVVSRTLADRVWPGEHPVGKRLLGVGPGAPSLEVIGVAEDVRHIGLTDADAWAPDVYLNLLQFPARTPAVVTVLARTRIDAERALRPLEATVRRAFADLPPYDAKTLEQRLQVQTSNGRFAMLLMDALAGISLLLAATGIYGVVSYMVTLRTREIGIRMALGSTRDRVLLLVLRRTLAPVVAGIVIGVAGIVPAGGYLRSLLYGLEPFDPASIAAMIVLLLAVGTAAAMAPAFRATRVSPTVTLRGD